MNVSLKKTSEPWLDLLGGINTDTLCNRILTADVCLSDLDDTDADSPAKKIVFWGIGSHFDPVGYARWCIETAVQYAGHGKKAESLQWKKYVDTFLRYPGAKASIQALFTPEMVAASLYPGVRELYALLPTPKFYITLNIPEVADAYGKILGFQGALAEVDDKERSVEQFVEEHPQFRSYFIKGDSIEDERMLDVLAFCRSRGKVDFVVSCYRADDPRKVNPRFDANVGKDYRKLVAALKSRSNL